ncbi:MAG TPA: hypothetical protein VHL53_14000 [Acidimicrobiia bacterium]|nr:hypothetical protein [Acidimicrobiia bacterium]
MVRYAVVVVVLLVLWTHWRAAYTGAVRAALDDLPAREGELDDLIGDLRDKRLAFRCRAVLADYRRDGPDLEEHRADALARVEHLERFAPLRRLAR